MITSIIISAGILILLGFYFWVRYHQIKNKNLFFIQSNFAQYAPTINDGDSIADKVAKKEKQWILFLYEELITDANYEHIKARKWIQKNYDYNLKHFGLYSNNRELVIQHKRMIITFNFAEYQPNYFLTLNFRPTYFSWGSYLKLDLDKAPEIPRVCGKVQSLKEELILLTYNTIEEQENRSKFQRLNRK